MSRYYIVFKSYLYLKDIIYISTSTETGITRDISLARSFDTKDDAIEYIDDSTNNMALPSAWLVLTELELVVYAL
jgi:hypothetical protein